MVIRGMVYHCYTNIIDVALLSLLYSMYLHISTYLYHPSQSLIMCYHPIAPKWMGPGSLRVKLLQAVGQARMGVVYPIPSPEYIPR